ncbi:MAG: NUDIX domain-containing protein [bacterium]
MKNVFIIGSTGTGKTTLGNFLIEQFNYKRVQLSSYLKQQFPRHEGESLFDYTQRITNQSKEFLKIDPDFFANHAKNNSSKDLGNIFDGVRNPRDFCVLFDPRRDIVINMVSSEKPMTLFEERGVATILSFCNFYNEVYDRTTCFNYVVNSNYSFEENFEVNKKVISECFGEHDTLRKQIESRRGLDYPAITICYVCHDGQGNYLMNKRSIQCNDEHGAWDFGGGRVEFGDSIVQTVHKELREEYGVTPKEINFLGYHDLFRTSDRGLRHWLCMIFLVEVDREQVINGEPHKFDEIKWVTLDNLPTPLHPLAHLEVRMVNEYKNK